MAKQLGKLSPPEWAQAQPYPMIIVNSARQRERGSEEGVIMNSEAEAARIPREMEEERTHNGAPWNCLNLKGHWVHLAGNKKTSSVCNISISCLYKADKALLRK